MDGIQLSSEPVAEIGPLVVTAPPWRFLHVVSARMYLLVLRNPRDPSRGLTLMTNTNSQALVQTAQGMMAALAEADHQMLGSLWDQEMYDELSGSPALLSAMAEAVTQSGAVGVQALLGSSGSSSSSSSGSCPAPAAPSAPPAPSAGAAAEAPPAQEEEGECPICYEPIHMGDAAMRCCGSGGAHHYFHAHCLQSWIRTCQGGRSGASCPVCRGRLQFHGVRLQQFLQSPGAAALSEDERSFLEQVADGLRGRSDWVDMSTLEKAAYAGGIVAAAGWGFMLGYSHTQHRASSLLLVQSVPQEHQMAQNLGWVAGLIVRVLRQAMQDKDREESRDRSTRRRRG